MLRLGFGPRVLGAAGLRASDGRQRKQQPHLSVSLIYLRDILGYLARNQITFYRLSDALAPYLASGEPGEFDQQIEQCAAELAIVGALAHEAGVRLTMHLGAHITLAASDARLAARARAEIVAQAALFQAMGLGPEAVLVLHVGAGRAEGMAALERFAERYRLLPPAARKRVVLEHDGHVWGLASLLPLHAACGIPLVYDHLHHRLCNPERLPASEALRLALGTWPTGMRPKVHFSTPRTEAHLAPRGSGSAILPPRPGQHSDYINPFEFAAFLELAHNLPPFDLLLEAKAADLALLRLREDLTRYAPELVAAK